jgi:hypothetical protein
VVAGVIGYAVLADEDPAEVVTVDGEESTEIEVVEPTPVEIETLSPEEVALSFIDARNAFDAESAQSLFAQDAVYNVDRAGGAESLADLPGLYDWYRVMDWTWNVDGCTSAEEDAGTLVVCRREYENALTRVVEGDTTTGSFEILVVDGEIAEFTHRFVSIANGWGAFLGFVTATNPDDGPLMVREFLGRQDDEPILTPESMALWEKHLAAFADSQTGN